MRVIQFIADNAASALEQIQQQLGPQAVVLSVRRLPAQGVARFWPGNRRIEVLAGLPEDADSRTADPGHASLPGEGPAGFMAGTDAVGQSLETSTSGSLWKSVAWLEAMGLLPAHASRLQNHLNTLHPAAPGALDAEWKTVCTALARFWPPPPPSEDANSPQTHVFIGPPGSGKTTVLCKWLTLAVLTEERAARVWRLDSGIANTAEFLTVHCEMLGAPVERFWSQRPPDADLLLIDLPGVEANDAQAIADLRSQLALIPGVHIHLVLNAAYEIGPLLEQWNAFSICQPESLIFSHMDEESRRIKLWNLVFGTNCSIRFLSSGQKIPGMFQKAVPGLLFPAEFRQ